MNSRRSFLKLLGGAAALAAADEFDPECLLWMPGRKVISIPTIVLADEWDAKTFVHGGMWKGEKVGSLMERRKAMGLTARNYEKSSGFQFRVTDDSGLAKPFML